MGLSMLEIGIMIFLIMACGVMIVSFVFSTNYKRILSNKTVVRGMNGLSGTKLNLACPSGQVISFKNYNGVITRGALVALGDPKCDAYYNPEGQNANFFNPNTTIDTLASGSAFTEITGCEGKEKCSFNVPDSSDSRLAGTCLVSTTGKIGFIGTYDCIASASQ